MSYDQVKLRAQLVAHEGLRLHPYPDSVGKLTIGVGRNLSDDGISASEAMALLETDIDRTVTELQAHVPGFDTLADARQRALIDMAFNLGLPRFLGFHDMLRCLAADDFDGAAAAMLASHWAAEVGPRAPQLAAMLRSGVDAA